MVWLRTQTDRCERLSQVMPGVELWGDVVGAWGNNRKVATAQECCDACFRHTMKTRAGALVYHERSVVSIRFTCAEVVCKRPVRSFASSSGICETCGNSSSTWAHPEKTLLKYQGFPHLCRRCEWMELWMTLL